MDDEKLFHINLLINWFSGTINFIGNNTIFTVLGVKSLLSVFAFTIFTAKYGCKLIVFIGPIIVHCLKIKSEGKIASQTFTWGQIDSCYMFVSVDFYKY